MVSLHFVFNYQNAKNDYRAFRVWASISEEAPAAERSCKAMLAWSQEENNKFWAAEQKFNRVWNRTMNVLFVILCVMFNIGLFIDQFDVNVYTYVTVQTIQVAHNR